MRKEKCSCCWGIGTVMRYPYFATQMPPLTQMRCEKCNGTGEVWVRTDNCPLVIDNVSVLPEKEER